MKLKGFFFALLGFVLANVLVVALAVADEGSAHPLRAIDGPQFDGAFLSDMIAHHQLGIQLAQLAAQNAQRDELKQFATESAAKRQAEIRDLQLLRNGGDASAAARNVPPGPNLDAAAAPVQAETGSAVTPPNVTQMAQVPEEPSSVGIETNREKLQALERASGDRFDELFVREMIAHDTTGLEMAQLGRQKASAGAVKGLADAIARSESDELKDLQQLRSELPK